MRRPYTAGEGTGGTQRPAFTLVELLVVIAIISALIAILLPAATSARRAAISVQCLSNLRQMAAAAHTYANDNRGFLPSGYFSVSQPPVSIAYNWDFTITTDVEAGTRQVRPGLLWQGRGDGKIQQCPAYDGRSNTIADPYTGYNYNISYIGRGQKEDVQTPARATQVRQPTRCALFGDGEYAGGANKFMRSPRPGSGDASFKSRHAGTQGFRHRGGTNVAFLDGHAATLFDRHAAGMNLPSHVGFLSDDNSLYGGERMPSDSLATSN